MKKLYCFFLIILLAGCSSNVSAEDIKIVGNAQYIEHGGQQLYTGDDEYGVIYIHLGGEQYKVGNSQHYYIEKFISSHDNSQKIYAEDFAFKYGMLCIPLTDSSISVGDTILLKHKHNKIGYLTVTEVQGNNSKYLDETDLDI